LYPSQSDIVYTYRPRQRLAENIDRRYLCNNIISQLLYGVPTILYHIIIIIIPFLRFPRRRIPFPTAEVSPPGRCLNPVFRSHVITSNHHSRLAPTDYFNDIIRMRLPHMVHAAEFNESRPNEILLTVALKSFSRYHILLCYYQYYYYYMHRSANHVCAYTPPHPLDRPPPRQKLYYRPSRAHTVNIAISPIITNSDDSLCAHRLLNHRA